MSSQPNEQEETEVQAQVQAIQEIDTNAIMQALPHLRERQGIFIGIEANIGTGKCLDPDTPVLLYDGYTVKAGGIEVGQRLMGPDSQPREVLSTTRGTGPMFEIKPKRAPSWICNDVHVLTVVDTLTDEVIDIPLNEFLTRDKTWRERQKLFTVPVEFPPVTEPEVDPYFVGLWLGDGRKDLSQGIQLTFPDEELIDYLRDFAPTEGCRLSRYEYPERCPTFGLVCDGKGNPLLEKLRHLMAPEQQDYGYSIPARCKYGSREVRSRLLAGLLDTDGYLCKGSFEIVQRGEQLADDIAFVARSLGLRVVRSIKTVPGYDRPYYRMSVSGDMTFLPMRVERKKPRPRKQKKNPLRFGFTVEPLGRGDYAGFTLDGDGRFLLGNFQVTHNTECANMLARLRTGYDGPTHVLFEPIKGRFKELLGLYYGDPKRWGFTFQMHALQARFRQHTLAAELVNNGVDVVQDRTIFADGCFGMTVREDGNMTEAEWGIYEDTFGAMKRFLRYPDVIVYLRTDPQTCFDRMKRRARTEESGVPLDYLRRIHDKHEMLADAMSRYTRVLRVDWNEFGDVENLNAEINKIAAEERPFMKTWNGL